jgi:dihydrodipicolinate synthase/N-acetylneuraminate lyase
MTFPLQGIIPPLVTPLNGPDELDHAGLENLVERVLGGGVHALFILGTTGEAPGLSYRLRRELIDRVCTQVAGRIPVLVGVTDTASIETIRLSEYAAAAGVDALVMAPPYYFPAGQPELMEYIEHMVPQLPLPVLLYNMPSHTKQVFEPDTVRRASDLPGVVGLKDSSGDMVYFHKVRTLMADKPDFSLLVGPEELLGEAVLLGAHGGVSGGANLFPELYVALYDAALAGEVARVRELHGLVMRISASIYSEGRHGSKFMKGIKCALSLEGVCNDYLAEPFHRFRDPERSRIQHYLDQVKSDLHVLLRRGG